jgi:hypothetical protein
METDHSIKEKHMSFPKALYQFFSSLRLTVWLLVAALVLVFFGTLDQVHLGIFAAQEKYFQSIIAIWGYPEQWPLGAYLHRVHLPIPGGYLVGFMMLANLACAHFRFFKLRWGNLGIVAIHSGLALLLISELVTNIVRKEHYLWFEEGQTSRHLTSYHEDELVLIDLTDPDRDVVVSIPVDHLKSGGTITHPALPFAVRVIHYFDNAVIARGSVQQPSVATRGLAVSMRLTVQPQPRTFRPNERNTSTAIVELASSDEILGSWLVANVLENGLPAQVFEYGDRTYEISLRYKRQYLPFSMKLLEFSHDRYPGTNIPRNFSSRIHLRDEGAGEDRETLIYMNNPLRYAGYTFYQSSFGPDAAGVEDRASQLQVVSNPGWLIPYIACILMTLGLCWQFIYGLWHYLTRQRRIAVEVKGETA